jgi:bifunctional ADP-heptose synthase (sugar kinase/adenylyltransferase)
MKLLAYHDAEGNISALLATNGPAGISLFAAPAVGRLVSEVDASDVAGLAGETLVAKLQEIAANHIVVEHTHSLRRKAQTKS